MLSMAFEDIHQHDDIGGCSGVLSVGIAFCLRRVVAAIDNVSSFA